MAITRLPRKEESKSAVPCEEVQQRTRSSREVSLVVRCSTFFTRSVSLSLSLFPNRKFPLRSRINPSRWERMSRSSTPELDCRNWRIGSCNAGSCCCFSKSWRAEDHREGRRHGKKGRTIRGERGDGGPLLPRSTLALELKGTISFLSTVTTTRS